MKNLVFASTLLLCITLFGGCEKAEDPCAEIACVQFISELQFKLIDSAGTDLLSGSNPVYQVSDVSLYHKQDTLLTSPVPLQTIQTGQDIVLKGFAAVTGMTLKVQSDRYNLTFGFEKIDCCAQRVSSVSIDSALACNSCPEIVRIPVE